MYALVEIGGKQYKAEKGNSLLIDLIDAKEGANLKFNTVTLLRTDQEIMIGKPYLDKINVEATVENPLVPGEKKIIFKYKQKVPHRVKRGHRQKYTKINITDIK